MSEPPSLQAKAIHEWLTQQLLVANLTYGHGTDNAADEAYALLAHVLDLNFYNRVGAQVVSTAQWQQIQTLLLARIKTRKPLPYLLNEAWFAGLKFFVDERVLVPRSPLAELILQGLQPWLGDREVSYLLDCATGSACIAIACASAFPNAYIDASDLSADALAVANKNVMAHQLQKRVHCYQANLFEGLPATLYDVIISNPPYVSDSEIVSLPAEYKHEPVLGFAGGGEKGLDLVAAMITTAADHLTAQGLLIVEVGDREAELMQRFPRLPFVWHEFSDGAQGVFILEASDLKHVR